MAGKVEKTTNDDGAGHPAIPDMAGTEPRPNLGEVLAAANNADWQQVVLNGGPPCFHFDTERGRFCLAAHRWVGHGQFHPFTGLADMIGLVVYNANLSVIVGSAPVSSTADERAGAQAPSSPSLRAQVIQAADHAYMNGEPQCMAVAAARTALLVAKEQLQVHGALFDPGKVIDSLLTALSDDEAE